MEPLASSADLRTLRGTYGTTNSHRYPGAKSCNALYVYSSSFRAQGVRTGQASLIYVLNPLSSEDKQRKVFKNLGITVRSVK